MARQHHDKTGPVSADEFVERLRAMGCMPLKQHGCHEVRDAAHEAAHYVQAGAKSWHRERLHKALSKKAHHQRAGLVRFELEARGVEMIICKKFDIEYDLKHWSFITWMETSKTLNVDIGDLDEIAKAVTTVSKQRTVKALAAEVLAMTPKARKP